jgi:hypothetical protein
MGMAPPKHGHVRIGQPNGTTRSTIVKVGVLVMRLVSQGL